jgi:hypothetical protein
MINKWDCLNKRVCSYKANLQHKVDWSAFDSFNALGLVGQLAWTNIESPVAGEMELVYMNNSKPRFRYEA